MANGLSSFNRRIAMPSWHRAIAVLVCLTLLRQCDRCWSQTLLDDLVTKGIEFREGVQVKLPAPTLTGKLTDEQLAQAKKELAGNDDWERFTRDSVVAPVTIKLEYITDSAGTRVGHSVHSAFVVHAKLASLEDKDLMQQIFGKAESETESGKSSGMKVTELSQADLLAAGVKSEASESSAARVSYSKVEFTLLDKIQLRGVLKVERTTEPGTTTIAWQLDPAFAADAKLRGSWLKVGEAEAATQPYAGWGGFLNVTRVSEEPEMLLMESRMLLHELPEWFNASNFVRSKLPLAIQEGARNFRRKLKLK